jgi:hypothetical protein
MTLGDSPRQADIFRSTASYCEGRVAPDSIYALLHRECFALFPDELFADLFTDIGRRPVPPMIVAVVMVLQRLEGLSDRDAVGRFAFNVRWKYAAGGLDFDHPGFAHTVLVDMRARLARSEHPERIFAVALGAARAAGLVGRRRVLDSTALYDAVTTMDTVTLLRSGIRGLLAAAGSREAALRALLRRDDDYRVAGKPACDYDDRAAREALVDALAVDASALLSALDAEPLPRPLREAAALLATLVGQDLESDDAERAHLDDLVGIANLERPPRRMKRPENVRSGVQRIVDLIGIPALVRNRRLDILYANRLGAASYSEVYRDPARPPNPARFVFLDPRARDVYTDWDVAAHDMAALLRAEAGRNPYDRRLSDRWASCQLEARSSALAGPPTMCYSTATVPDGFATRPSVTSRWRIRTSISLRTPTRRSSSSRRNQVRHLRRRGAAWCGRPQPASRRASTPMSARQSAGSAPATANPTRSSPVICT